MASCPDCTGFLNTLGVCKKCGYGKAEQSEALEVIKYGPNDEPWVTRSAKGWDVVLTVPCTWETGHHQCPLLATEYGQGNTRLCRWHAEWKVASEKLRDAGLSAQFDHFLTWHAFILKTYPPNPVHKLLPHYRPSFFHRAIREVFEDLSGVRVELTNEQREELKRLLTVEDPYRDLPRHLRPSFFERIGRHPMRECVKRNLEKQKSKTAEKVA